MGTHFRHYKDGVYSAPNVIKSKSRANKIAEGLKDKGYKVRILPIADGYLVLRKKK